jgi:molecular chaperone GrpE
MRHEEPEKSRPESSSDTNRREPKGKKGELDELRGTIESLLKEKDELFGKLQRISADYANFQKRVPRQIADSIVYEKERIIKTLLPVLDNFEHTLQNAGSAEKDGLIKGIRIIYDQLLDVLKSHNVEQVEALGETFNPAVHEAMTQQINPEKEDGVVLEEFQKGYRLNGRVIRPSRVVVNKLPATEMERQRQTQPTEEATDECETTDRE